MIATTSSHPSFPPIQDEGLEETSLDINLSQ